MEDEPPSRRYSPSRTIHFQYTGSKNVRLCREGSYEMHPQRIFEGYGARPQFRKNHHYDGHPKEKTQSLWMSSCTKCTIFLKMLRVMPGKRWGDHALASEFNESWNNPAVAVVCLAWEQIACRSRGFAAICNFFHSRC